LEAIVSVVTPLPQPNMYVLKLGVAFTPGFFQPYEQMFELLKPIAAGQKLEVDWIDPKDHDKGLNIVRRL
jgi:hypothetical protein